MTESWVYCGIAAASKTDGNDCIHGAHQTHHVPVLAAQFIWEEFELIDFC